MPKPAVKKSKSKNSFLTRLSKRRKLLVVLAVAVIGVGTVLASHAATGPRIAIASYYDGKGYWVAATDGGVFSVGDAPFYGSMGGTALAAPIVDMVATNDGRGYYLVGQDGGVFAFGDAKFQGSLPKNYPSAGVKDIVGMAVDPATGGYWLVGADGGVFSFNATFYGSMGGKTLAKPVVGMVSSSSGHGYWLTAADGGVFAFGDAPFKGSLAGKTLAKPISGIARQAGTNNYWLVAQDGGVFSFGAPFYGSLAGTTLTGAVMGMTSTPDGSGYWQVGADGGVFSFGDAVFQGTPPQISPTCPSGYSGTYPNCTKLTCPSGYTGTYPNCAAPVVSTTTTTTATAATTSVKSPTPTASAGTSTAYGDGCGGDATHIYNGQHDTSSSDTRGSCNCNNGTVIGYNGPIPNSSSNPGCSPLACNDADCAGQAVVDPLPTAPPTYLYQFTCATSGCKQTQQAITNDCATQQAIDGWPEGCAGLFNQLDAEEVLSQGGSCTAGSSSMCMTQTQAAQLVKSIRYGNSGGF